MKSKTFEIITSENIHIWNPMNPFAPNKLLAQIPDGKLQEFKNADSAVNGLFLQGFKQSARELDKKYKNRSQHEKTK